MEEIKETKDEKTVMSGSIADIASALSKAQGELETVKKGAKGYGYNYSDLTSVINIAKPILTKHELAVVQLIGECHDVVRVTTILTHSSGQFFKTETTGPNIEMKGCNEIQRNGAVQSYIRRYAYQAILGLSSEDNDASSKEAPKAPVRNAAKAAPVRSAPKAAKSSGDGFRNIGGI